MAAIGDNGNHFFYEDIVYRFDRRGRVHFGFVMENSDDMSSDSEDELDTKLGKGEVRVFWHPESKEEVVNQATIGLLDRSLMPSDVVRHMIPGKDTQRGYCRDIHMKADVCIAGTHMVIKNVPVDRFRPITNSPLDSIYCLDNWVGCARTVINKLVLKTTCGAKFELTTDAESSPFVDLHSNMNAYVKAKDFYPNQILYLHGSNGKRDIFKNTKWLTPVPDMRVLKKMKTFTVLSVEVEGIWMNWQCQCQSVQAEPNDSMRSQPSTYVTGEDLSRLKRLNKFDYCALQINDRNYLTISEEDEMIKRRDWIKSRGSELKLNSSINDINTKSFNNVEKETPKELNVNDKRVTKTLIHSQNCLFLPSPNNKSIDIKLGMKITNTIKVSQNQVSVKLDKKMYGPKKNSAKNDDSDWLTDDEIECVSEDEPSSNSLTDSLTTESSRASTPTPRCSPKRSNLIKKLKFDKHRNRNAQKVVVKPGDEVVTEVLLVFSTATVVWQDGTIQDNIPTTDLFPIHHLDDHEFFPGDFVLKNNEKSLSYTEYGSIQKVDHRARIALVKWFKLNVGTNPTFIEETEVSVYELKDNPDYQFRPGIMVIRIANHSNDESVCSVGQVIDNHIDGRVFVWWIDDNKSLCWPQDLFDVGRHDREMLGDFEDSDDSWETESEISEMGGVVTSPISIKSRITNNLHRACTGIWRLIEMFEVNPNLEKSPMMHENLLNMYKKCRFIDRLMNTNFFHEDKFIGLIEKIPKNQPIQIDESSSTHKTVDHIVTSFEKNAPVIRKVDKSIPVNYSQPKDLTLIPTTEKTNDLINTIISNITIASEKTFHLKIRNSSADARDLGTFICHQNEGFLDDSGIVSKKKYVTESIGESSISNNEENGRSDVRCLKSSNNDSLNIVDVNQKTSIGDNSGDVCFKLCSLIRDQLHKILTELQNNSLIETKEVSIMTSEANTINNIDNVSGIAPIAQLDATTELTLAEDDDLPVNDECCADTISKSLPSDSFKMYETAPTSHHFYAHPFSVQINSRFINAVNKEHKLLSSSLPDGVWVRTFEDRLDLLSVMIAGPSNTPYEDGLFLFELKLDKNYPMSPPTCHYISYCTDRLNPNLYEDGKVCISLLGTWTGKGTETWCPTSTLLQVIVSIQGLILVQEPYFNEAGYEKQIGTQHGNENAQMYNEMVVIKIVQSMKILIENPPELFKFEILEHFKANGRKMYNRIKSYKEFSEQFYAEDKKNMINKESIFIHNSGTELPNYPLLPGSRGFCLSLSELLEAFDIILKTRINV